MTTARLFATVLAFFIGIALYSAMFVVSQTEQALVLQLGSPVRVVQEPGLHFKAPFYQNVEFYDKRLLDFNAEPKEVIASDQERLNVDAFVRYRITDPLKFKQTVADERNMKNRLNAILESSLRQVIGSQPLSAVVSDKRPQVMQNIRALVNAQAVGGELDAEGNIIPGQSGGFGIEIVDVRVMRADLPKENSEGIYRRMQSVALQESKQSRAKGAEDAQKIRATAEKERTVILAEAQKKADILRGQGESQAIRIFAEATGNDPEFYQFYRSMQAYRKALKPEDTTLVLSPASDFLRYMDKGAQ